MIIFCSVQSIVPFQHEYPTEKFSPAYLIMVKLINYKNDNPLIDQAVDEMLSKLLIGCHKG